MGIKAGDLPVSTIDTSDYLLITEGQAPKRVSYSNVKSDIIGTETLIPTSQTVKGSINELTQNLLESTGYGVISGLTVSAQATPNMTVNVASGILDISTGARQTPTASPTLAVATADITNPRIDIVYVATDGTIGYLVGTASATPTAPTTPTGAFLLAEISVLANATTIATSNIIDKRKIKNTTDSLSASLSDLAYEKTSRTITVGVGKNFTTIQSAIDSVKKYLYVGIFIDIVIDAGTYNENVLIRGFYGGGTLRINNGRTIIDTIVNNVAIVNCLSMVSINGITATSTSAHGFNIIMGLCIICAYISSIATTTIYSGLIASQGSGVQISNSTFSNRANGISAETNSKIFSSANNGTGNTFGLSSAKNATIGKAGTQPAGTASETSNNGGVIR